MKQLWIDTETTGLNPDEDKILEIAIVYVNPAQPDKEDTFHRYIKYTPDIYEKGKTAMEMNGLTPEFLEKNGQPSVQVFNDLVAFLNKRIFNMNKKDKAIVCGYNVKFDKDFLFNFFKQHGSNYMHSYMIKLQYDVWSLVALAVKEGIIPWLERYNLSTVAFHFGLAFSAHNAMDDILVTRNISLIIEEKLKIQGATPCQQV